MMIVITKNWCHGDIMDIPCSTCPYKRGCCCFEKEIKDGDVKMTNKWLVDDAGTLIDMETRNTYDYMEDIVNTLNEQEELICEQSIQLDYLKNENKQLNERIKELQHKLDSLSGLYVADNKEFKHYWRLE